VDGSLLESFSLPLSLHPFCFAQPLAMLHMIHFPELVLWEASCGFSTLNAGRFLVRG
jgi:hypothetical protein